MKNGKRYFNSARGWERVFRKSQKKRVAPTEPGSKGSILVISQDEKHWQHWRKTHCTLHPFPISSAQSQSGRGPMWDSAYPQSPRPGAAPNQSLSRILLWLPYALLLPIYLHFLHSVPIALTLEYWVSWKYRKGRFFYQVSLLCTTYQHFPQGVVWILGRSTIWIELLLLSGKFPSGLRVWRETSTHKSRIKESRSIGIATQRGGQKGTVLVEFSWDCSSLPQRLSRKKCPSAILPNHYLQISLEQGIIMYSRKWSVLISLGLSWIKILSF